MAIHFPTIRIIWLMTMGLVLANIACTDSTTSIVSEAPSDGSQDMAGDVTSAAAEDMQSDPQDGATIQVDAHIVVEDGSLPDIRMADIFIDALPDADLDRGVGAVLDAQQDVLVIVDAAPREPVEARCNDQEDDDGDDRIDCEDPDCRGAPVCFDLRETCDDGRDNNGDDRVDCDDVTCHLEPGCPAPDVEPFTTEQVEALFVIECVPCHGPPQPEVQLDLTPPFLDRILNVPSFEVELPYIKSGDASQSWIYQKIRYRQIDFMGDGDGMPPEHTWTASDVQRLGLWIDGLDTQ